MDMESELLFRRLAGIGVFAHLVLPVRCEILFIAAGKLQDVRVCTPHHSDIRRDIFVKIRWRSMAMKIGIHTGMEIRFEECVAIFRVCCYTNFILHINMINLRSNFLQQDFSIFGTSKV